MYFYCVEVLEKSLYFLIIGIAFAAGQREVDCISVNGDNVVKTDIASYTIYETNQYERTLTISCLSFLPVTSKISLLRNGTILNAQFADSTFTNRSNIAIIKLTFNTNNVTFLVGGYSCRFISVHTYNGTQFEYFIEKEIQIYTTTERQGCTSSVGSKGYFGEKVTFYCVDPGHSLRVDFFQGQELGSLYSLQAILLQSNASFKCIYDLSEAFVCSHDFMVYPSLEIEISPKIFTLDSHVMEFSCSSTPPRMLYWELIRDGENILDLHNDDRRLQVGFNITIKQKAGWSSLRVSITGKTHLCIRKVECYAYGTRTRSVAYATSLRGLYEGTTTTKQRLKEYSKATQEGGTECNMYESEGDTLVYRVVVLVSALIFSSTF